MADKRTPDFPSLDTMLPWCNGIAALKSGCRRSTLIFHGVHTCVLRALLRPKIPRPVGLKMRGSRLRGWDFRCIHSASHNSVIPTAWWERFSVQSGFSENTTGRIIGEVPILGGPRNRFARGWNIGALAV